MHVFVVTHGIQLSYKKRENVRLKKKVSLPKARLVRVCVLHLARASEII